MFVKKKNIYLAFLLAASVMCGTSSAKAQNVIPVPLKVEKRQGAFTLSDQTKLYTNLKGKEKKMFMEYLQTLPVQFKKGKKHETGNTLSLLLTDKNEQLPSPESYVLNVTPEGVTVEATSGAGLFYGFQTLLQMAEHDESGKMTVQAVHIADTPRFEYRGFMMDVSRHFRSKEFIKKQLDLMAYYKLNRLHLHLTDAAGWRIEIKKYPLLTEFAAWRPQSNWKQWWNEGGRKYCRYDEPGAYGGFYSQKDIRELVEYARQRHIVIIPEIEMPAHSEEVLTAYPELSCTGEPYKHADFCVGNEATFTFLEDVLKEVMELFPSEYIHVGGDEAGKAAWKTCPKCQQRMKDENLSDVNELQSYLIHRVEVFLNKNGRKLLGWDEIMEGGLAPNATVMSWRGEEGGIKAVKSGHRAVMTPGSHCYFDFYQDAPYSQPEAIGGYTPLEKVYSYNPVPAALTEDESKLIYGVQANQWAEYIETDEHYEYMMYPRLLALAEVAWSAPERKNWPDFHARALKAVPYMQSKGYHPFDLAKEIGNRPEASRPVEHLALGKPVKYNAPYNKSYPAQGDKTLTDGIRGSWTYSDGAWQGFISHDRLDVTVDLGAVTDIHSIAADFMQVVGPEVFLPVEVIISVSDDGEQYKELSRQTHQVVKSDAVVFKNFAWKGEAKGRYVRYQARAGKEFGGWVFTDEIVVR